MREMESAPTTRVITHLHGARVPSISDGYPEDWFGPGRNKLCYYPNQQETAGLWMHDHAMGVNHFNVFAGLMGWYLIRDELERDLNLPSGKYELPLVIYDRSFDPQGQLYSPNPPDKGAWSQEFLGDAIIVNGKVRPYHEAEPRKYRLRIANTANSFFSLVFKWTELSCHWLRPESAFRSGRAETACPCSRGANGPDYRFQHLTWRECFCSRATILSSCNFVLAKIG
jgi:spore coat protein A